MGKETVRETMKLSFPKIPPYKGILDYCKSRATLDRIQVRSFQSDVARNDPQLTLTTARRKFNRTEQELVDKREVYKETRQKLDNQWKDLREKETEFRQMFEAMNHFIITNEEKRTRAKSRYQDDTKIRKKRVEAIEKLKEKLTFVYEVKKEMDNEIIKHKLYEKYLDSVVTQTAEFRNSLDCIDRYESLTRTKNELGERQTKNLKLLETTKIAVQKMTDEYMFRILGLNNIVASLNSRYKETVSQALHWESLVWAIKKKAFHKFQEITEVKQACWNIYKMMCKRKGEAIKIDEKDLENQMNYIKKTLREMRLVREEAIHMSKKTISSIKGQTSKVS